MRTLKALPFLLLISCSSFESNNIAPGYIDTYKAIKQAILGFEENTLISRQLVDDIPYASMTLKIGKGPKGLMILESLRGDEQIWVSSDSVYIVILNGRVIKTEGLENNLKRVFIPKIDFNEVVDKQTLTTTAFYSYTNPVLNNLRLELIYSVKGKEEITILEKSYNLELIEERVINKELGWDFLNLYWVDTDGFVWKSVQTILPKIPEFMMEVTKKPSL